MLVDRFLLEGRKLRRGGGCCFGCRLPVSFLPLCVLVYMERCAVGPRPQGLLVGRGRYFT
jgi:hypothetical protein